LSAIVGVDVPDIGDFEEVEVVEILVRAGDTVAAEDSLISIESDKATLEIPAPCAGVVREVVVSLGDRVSQGTTILRIEAEAGAFPDVEVAPASGAAAPEAPAPLPAKAEARPTAAPPPAQRTPVSAPGARTESDLHFDLVVLGGGPGGYTAAFRAADLGRRVALVERHAKLGGVCLNVGCIPSKALLHLAEVVNDARELGRHGVEFGEPAFDLAKLRAFKQKTVDRLTRGLAGLAEQRNVEVIRGEARFSAPDQLIVAGEDGERSVSFDAGILATGSRPVAIPGLPLDDPRVMDSTGALELEEVPGRLLVIGGGIIGLEMATVYDALGARITIVELTDELIPGCDRDLVQPLQRRLSRRCENVFLGTRVTAVAAEPAGLRVSFDGPNAPADELFDRVLVAVGRRPNSDALGLEAIGVEVDQQGFVGVDATMRTSLPHLLAIGDVVGQPMLAHKAMHEGKVAAEVVGGLPAAFDPIGIPSVAYTDPEVAWVGLTETQAKMQGVAYEKGVFPWSASGRALSIGRSDGATKLLVDPESRRVLGAGVVGRNAGELIAEAVLALELGADAEDLGLTIHPHPTLSETLGLAAEMVEGTITDLYAPKRE
jgi:dihydrolipoamide dehydrogenase